MARPTRAELAHLAIQLCSLLDCQAVELRLALTPEGLIELLLQRQAQNQVLSPSIRIGSAEDLLAWATQHRPRTRQRATRRAPSPKPPSQQRP